MRIDKSQELKNLDVERVDAVDKPATGRAFLLFKAREIAAARGQALTPEELDRVRKTIFPNEDQEWMGPRSADTGDDSLGRAYDDAVMERLGGSGNAPQEAEHGVTATPGLPAGAAPNFPGAGEGELHRPRQDYAVEQPGLVGVKVGPNFLLNPQNSGLADAGMFRKPEPVTKRRERGLFRSLVAPITEATGGPASSFFDEPGKVSKAASKELGDGMFSDVFKQGV